MSMPHHVSATAMAGCVSFSWIAVLSGNDGDIAERLDVPSHQVLQGGGGEEILLPQPQFLPGGRGVRGVEHFRNRLGAHLLGERAGVVAVVERFQAHADRPGAPTSSRSVLTRRPRQPRTGVS